MRNVVNSGVTDSDLRHALLFYLAGIGLFLLIIALSLTDLVKGMAADPGTASPEFTPQIIYNVLLSLAVPLMILSQLWYLRTKHIYKSCDNRTKFYKQMLPEVTVFFLVTLLLAVFFSLPGGPESHGIISNLLYRLSVLVVLGLIILIIYYPVIVIWNVKRVISARYPKMNESLKIASSVVLGLMLAVAYIIMTSTFLLIFIPVT